MVFALYSPKYHFGARLHFAAPSRADFQFNFCGSEPNACESARAKRRGQSHAPVEYFGKVEINDRITPDCSIAHDAQSGVAKSSSPMRMTRREKRPPPRQRPCQSPKFARKRKPVR
jgi:hypothetical protein